MTIADLPMLTAFRAKMRWHATRQSVLAQNVANADTPGFAPRDLRTFDVQALARAGDPGPVAALRTHAAHISEPPRDATAPFRADKAPGFETTPAGNAVVLEEEMMKVAANQSDYQAVVGLYQRGVAMIRSALGKRA